MHGVRAVIVMPDDAPAVKVEGTRALGAEVVPYRRGDELREEIGARLAAERGLTLVRPFDDPQVIAGQGTVGLEIAAQAAALGGGGGRRARVLRRRGADGRRRPGPGGARAGAARAPRGTRGLRRRGALARLRPAPSATRR